LAIVQNLKCLQENNKMSKRFFPISLLIILISACTYHGHAFTPPLEKVQSTQPVPSSTEESESTLPTTASPDLAATENALPRLTFSATIIAVDTATAVFSACPGAPGPYAAIGNQVTVVAEDVDKLKLRSEPKISPDTLIRELTRFTQLKIVGGPLCVQSAETGTSYWFWQVYVPLSKEIGWIAEGDVQHPFISVSVGNQYLPSTTTAQTAATPLACPGPHAHYSARMQVTVIAGNSDKLKLRSEPKISPDTVISELDQFTIMYIMDGPLCVTAPETRISYWLWKVKVISIGKTGWVAEGNGQNHFIEQNGP